MSDNPNRPLPTTGLTVNFTQAQADALYAFLKNDLEGLAGQGGFTRQLDAALSRFSDAYAELQQERADRQHATPTTRS